MPGMWSASISITVACRAPDTIVKLMRGSNRSGFFAAQIPPIAMYTDEYT
jgi:hypothetical protein